MIFFCVFSSNLENSVISVLFVCFFFPPKHFTWRKILHVSFQTPVILDIF